MIKSIGKTLLCAVAFHVIALGVVSFELLDFSVFYMFSDWDRGNRAFYASVQVIFIVVSFLYFKEKEFK